MKIYLILFFTGFIGVQCQAQSWTRLNDTPFAKISGVTFSHEGKGYIIGGDEFVNETTLWEYDPSSDSWTELPHLDMEMRGRGIMGHYYQGKVYYGFGGGGPKSSRIPILHDLWALDLSDMTTEHVTDFPEGEDEFGFTSGIFIVHENKVFAGSGFGFFDNLVSHPWWMYDIATDIWEEKPRIPSHVHESMQFAFGDYLYVMGGHETDDWYKYNILEDTWESINDQLGARHTSAFSSYNGKAYIISGDKNGHFGEVDLDKVFMEYDPVMDTWTAIPAQPHDAVRFFSRSFVIDNNLYFLGGGSNSMSVFDLSSINPTTAQTSVEIKELSIHPSPVRTKINLAGIEYISDNTVAIIYNHTGRQMYSGKLTSNVLNVSSFTPGTYLLKIITDKYVYTGNFVKI